MEQSIKIESKLNNFCKIDNFINSIFNELQFSRKLYCKIYLSVNEAVNNAIFHGNSNDEEKYVTIDFITDDNTFQFLISDEGGGFDFSSVKDPTEKENIYNESGRGIFIMKKYADHVYFLENGTKVKLIFNKLN
ncbi:MAG: ATP-binding protein [Prolixibacteraceae bacterium]|nr:ATP-binding protein [Prolixibacteraceae bacterium]